MRRWFWILDVVVVLAFVVIGRENHGFTSGIGDYVRVAAPFLIGLAVTTVSLRAWRKPTDLLTGLFLALGTVLIGMITRRIVWDDGTAISFVTVTTGFLIAGMVGWRLVALGIQRIVTVRRSTA